MLSENPWTLKCVSAVEIYSCKQNETILSRHMIRRLLNSVLKGAVFCQEKVEFSVGTEDAEISSRWWYH